MLSPDQLREMAWEKLRAAKNISAGRDYATSLHVCGLAVEHMLKARITVDRNLPGGFPEDKQEFKSTKNATGLQLDKHDFTLLLSLTDQRIETKLKLLKEWSTCQTWTIDTRYYVVQSVTKQTADEMIRAAEIIIREIEDHPGLKPQITKDANAYVKLWEIEKNMAVTHGEFSLFGIWHRTGSYEGASDVVVAAPWIDPHTRKGANEICDEINKAFSPMELDTITGVIALEWRGPFVKTLRRLPMLSNTHHSTISLQQCVVGNISISSALLITSQNLE